MQTSRKLFERIITEIENLENIAIDSLTVSYESKSIMIISPQVYLIYKYVKDNYQEEVIEIRYTKSHNSFFVKFFTK